MGLMDYLPRVQFDRAKWNESTAPVRGLLADLSPGYGDVLAAQRGAQAFNQAYGLLGQGEVLKGAGRAAEGLAEHLSVVPGVGELATLSKGAVSMLPGLLGMTAKPSSTAGRVVRYETKSGRGLMNNQVLDRSRLTDDEEFELDELLDFGLEQPKGVGAGNVFAFTPEGEAKHMRLLELLKKASKEPVVRKELSVSGDPTWTSHDGQVAYLLDLIKNAD